MGSTQVARRLGAAATAVVMATVLMLAAPVGADIVIEFDELIFGAEGSSKTVAEASVPAELVGRTCEISVLAENQASVHVGNDVIVTTGKSQAAIVGVEDEANGGTNQTYNVVMGPTIVVDLRFGPDAMSSLGFSLAFDCDKPITTTTDSTVASRLDGGELDGDETTTMAVTGGSSSNSCTTGDDPTGGDGTTTSSAVVTDAPTGPASAGSDCPTDDPTEESCSIESSRSTSTGSASAPTSASSSASASSGCPDGALVDTSSSTTSSTVPVETAPDESTSGAGDAAVTALPSTPVANAVVAAPAYTG